MRTARFARIIGLVIYLVVTVVAQESAHKVSRAAGENAVVSKVTPEYPAVARQLKIQGEVELEALVGENGAVDKVTIVSGNPVLTKPAAEALKKWKYKPFVEDGKATPALVPVYFTFKM